MSQFKIYNLKNEAVGTEDVSDTLVKAKFKPSLMHDYVTMQRRKMRQGTASTKTRAEVSGSGKKPFKQKGSGNARQGTLIGPHQPGGGIAFGPRPRSYETGLNKKAKSQGICQALSQKNFEGRLFILDDFQIKSGKTKEAVTALKKFKADSAVIVGNLSTETMRSLKNVPSIKGLSPAGVNVYDILRHDFLFVTKASIKELNDRVERTMTKKKGASA